MATRAALVDAARDLNKVLSLVDPIDLKQGVDGLRAMIKQAADLIREDDVIDEKTRAVIDELTKPTTETEETEEGAEDGEVRTTKKTKTVKEPKTPRAKTVPGEFSPVRAGTKYQTILNMAADGKTVDDIAAHFGVKRADIMWYRNPLRKHGIDFEATGGGKITLILPPGKTLADCVAAAA